MRRLPIALLFFVFAACGGDSGGDGPDPEKAAEGPLPDYNADAKFNGKTVMQYAEGLDDLNPRVQFAALQAIARFKVDGLPARGKVKALLDGDRDDKVKLGALNVLAEMKAPEAAALVRQKLADPKFFKNRGSYGRLLAGASQMGIDASTLQGDVMKILESDRAHAETLMVMNRLPAEAQNALAKAVFESEHGPEAKKHFLRMVGDLAFLDEAAKLKYVRDNLATASQMKPSVHNALLKIGTLEAMDLALQLDTGHIATRYQLMNRFAAKVDPQEILARMHADAKAATQRRDIDQICRYMQSLCMNTKRTKPDAYAALNKSFGEAMLTMTTDGPTDDHRGAAASLLLNYVVVNKDAPLSMLDPVFGMATNPEAHPQVRNSIGIQLSRYAPQLYARDKEAFLTRCVDGIYACQSADAATNMLRAVTTVARMPEPAGAVIEAIAAKADAHLDQWSMNAALAVLLSTAGQPKHHRTLIREKASIAAGKMLVSEKADLAYLKQYMNRGRGQLALIDYNTVDGAIGMLEPTIFAKRKTINHEFYPNQLGQVMVRVPRWLAQDAAAKAKWKAFLEKVAAEGPEEFAKFAKMGLRNRYLK